MRQLVVFKLLFLSISSWAQDTLTLSQAIDNALYNNYNIRIERNNNEIVKNNVTRGNAGFLPTVDINASQNNAIVNGEQIRGGNSEAIEDQTNKSTVIGGTINWTIFDGRRMFFNYDRLKELQLLSEADLRFAIESIIYNVTQVYYSAALEEQRLNSFTSNLELSEVRVQISKDKYEVGRASKMEYLQAQVDFNSDKSVILSQQEVLAARKFELLQLMGSSDTIDFHLVSTIEFDEDPNLDDLINSVDLQNAQLISLKHANEVAMLNKSVLESGYLPSLSVFTGYNYSEVQRAVGFAFESNSTELAYGFSVAWRIFDGFNLRRQIQNSSIEIENATLQYQNQRLQILTQLKTAYVRYRNNLSLMLLESDNLEVAKENNEIAQERYRIGLSNPLELREAQINFVNAEIRYQNAAYAAKLAEIELLFLSGTTISYN